ncbi:MAG: adenylyltransferase/cytidyltransferase family protein [Rickettsiales bacterium]|jgi:cytidyltransferase-like protein|nr:adenylyltransferase/cytidyltransferase family protein [Rickettsiales bacterium]
MAKKVFVSGVYDLLHSGHIYFFETCAKFGDLYVGVGSDESVTGYKRPPVNNENVRLYMIKSVKFVKDAVILRSAEPIFNFKEFVENLKPDIFVVNDDSSYLPEKEEYCKNLGIEFKLLKREAKDELPELSTTAIIKKVKNNY